MIEPTTVTCEVVPAEDRHLAFLYHLACEHEPGWLRVSRSGVPTPFEFVRRVNAHDARQFVLLDRGDLVGAGAIFAVNPRHGTATVDVVMNPDASGTDAAERSAYDRLLTLAFVEMHLRKVFVRYPEWLPPLISSNWKPTTLGHLTGHLRHQGQDWSMGVQMVDRPEDLP